MRGVRVAFYYAPEVDDPLWSAGCRWLGRDAELGADIPQPAIPMLAAATSTARRYGFHATLVAPFRISTGWDEVMQAAHMLAARTPAFALPRLVVGLRAGSPSLLLEADCPPLLALHQEALAAIHPHRLQLDDADLARRRLPGPDADEEANLLRWGYPHVRERFRFHMTLAAAGTSELLPAAEAHFATAVSQRRMVTSVCVFTERAAPGEMAPLLLAERIPLS